MVGEKPEQNGTPSSSFELLMPVPLYVNSDPLPTVIVAVVLVPVNRFENAGDPPLLAGAHAVPFQVATWPIAAPLCVNHPSGIKVGPTGGLRVRTVARFTGVIELGTIQNSLVGLQPLGAKR